MPEITNKGFKEGLESLLADAWHEDFQEQTTLFAAPAPPSKRASRASGGKHFSDNLSNLLEEALKETIAEKTQSFKEDDFSTLAQKIIAH
ncbi:MAG: hypothetical protein HC892_03755 [Saprospiraceae bacterium]|nr:hypothetical protein [Saprospiraceae bacterium]